MARLTTRLKEYRARHDLTQEQLAEIVGVRRETISNLERGDYNPSLILALQIAEVLEAAVEEIFILEDKDGE